MKYFSISLANSTATFQRAGALFILLFALCGKTHAQEKWTLQNCIDFYKINNTRVQQEGFTREKARLQLRASKKAFLPVVDARWRSAGNWGFLIDPSTNILDRRFNMGNQMSLNVNWNLFNGPYTNPLIKLRTQELAIAEHDYQATVNATFLDITFLYLQVLLGDEQVGTAKQEAAQLANKQRQIARQVAEGVADKRSLLNIESQLADKALQVVNAENNLDKSKFNLMQTMGIRQSQLIEVEPIDVSDSLLAPNFETLFPQAISEESFAEVLSARAQVAAAAAKIHIVRYNKLPILSVGAQLATRTSNFQKAEFGTQLDNNLNQQAAVSLDIPIFNHFYQNNIALAKLNLAAAQVSYIQAKEDMKQRIFTVFLDYKSAYRKFIASQAGYRALMEEHRFAEKQLQVGMIGAVDYGEVQSRLSAIRSLLMQNKYDCLFKLKILAFYQAQSRH